MFEKSPKPIPQEDHLQLVRELEEDAYGRAMLDDAKRSARRTRRPDAEDLGGEAVVKLLEYERSAGPIRNPAGLRHTVVSNTTLDIIRKERRQPAIASLDDPDRSLHPIDLQPSPEDSLLQKERRRQLWRALIELEPRSRRVLVGYHLLGYTSAELASALGTTAGNVNQLAKRGRDELRRRLGADRRQPRHRSASSTAMSGTRDRVSLRNGEDA